MSLKSFRTFENDERDLLSDLDSIGIEQHKGWLVSTTTAYERDQVGSNIYAVIAKNPGEASVLIMESMGIEDEDDLEGARKGVDFNDGLEEAMNNILQWDGRFEVVVVYEDLRPFKNEDYCLEIDWTNPIMAAKDVKYAFPNADQILGSKMSTPR
jgi:hypothetical protein